MKNILIPIDFKFNSYDGVDYLINFFQKESCNFYFLNTYTYNFDGLNALSILQEDDDWFEKPKCNSEKILGYAIQKYTYENLNKKHKFYAISESIDLIEGIKKTIEKLDIDLVAIARKKALKDEIKRYSKNTKHIIEHIRECPVMIIPKSAKLQENPEFVLISSFEIELPKTKLENWYEFVKIANGSIKIVILSNKNKMTQFQKENLTQVRLRIEKLFEIPVILEHLETANDLRGFAQYHIDHIICLIARKPDFWRKFGLTKSQIINLGPLKNTSLFALHH